MELRETLHNMEEESKGLEPITELEAIKTMAGNQSFDVGQGAYSHQLPKGRFSVG